MSDEQLTPAEQTVNSALVVAWIAAVNSVIDRECRPEDDVDPGNWSRVNENPHPARLGRGLDHETHQAYS